TRPAMICAADARTFLDTAARPAGIEAFEFFRGDPLVLRSLSFPKFAIAPGALSFPPRGRFSEQQPDDRPGLSWHAPPPDPPLARTRRDRRPCSKCCRAIACRSGVRSCPPKAGRSGAD